MKDEDEFTFIMQYIAHSKSVCKWIMYFGSHKPHNFAKGYIRHLQGNFSRYVHLGDDSMDEAIGMGPLLLKLKQHAN